jgi:hypothetical protein
MYKGRRGCGKTLTMVKDALNFYNKGWEIYSNFDIAIPYKKLENEHIININENTKIKDCVLLIDEIQTIIDSRRSMRKENLNFSYFVQQIRKRNIILLCTTQFTKTTDIRLREHTDIVVKPKIYREYPIVEATYYDITSEEELNYIDERIIIYNPQAIFNLYDTNEIKQSVRETEKVKNEY